MSLQTVRFWMRRSARRFRPSGDHIRAYCLAQGDTCDIRTGSALRNSFVIGFHSLSRNGIARAPSRFSEAAGIWWPRRTPQPTSSELMSQSAEKPARHISVARGPCLPLAFLRKLDRRMIMRSLDTLPGESNASIISSIINLVCPQCGGRMSEFQCEGRCRRNWLAEWEWANHVARSSKPRLFGHSVRSVR